MKIFTLALTLSFSLLNASEYWQQFVTYEMNVRLDTSEHTVGGHSTITYKNNSPDTLHHFYLKETLRNSIL